MLSIRLPKELEDRLDALAKSTGRTKSYYARQAIEEYIEDLEDLAAAEKALRDIKEGKEKTIPWEEAKKQLGF